MRSTPFLFWGFVILALCAYSLPWLVNPEASLTLNAYDLAEWSSLHPAIRAATPPLAVTFALRVLLLLLGAAVAFAPPPLQAPHGLRIILVFVIAAALLPPIEFFSSGFNDNNYRQQFALAVVMLVIGLIGLSQRLTRWHQAIQTALVVACIVGSITAMAALYPLMQAFQLPVRIGAGAVLYVIVCCMYGAALINKRGNFRQATS